tara:strand:+ start:585 stop:1337 length:753 start_codon:yes stop_codon:yes gene_type:complete
MKKKNDVLNKISTSRWSKSESNFYDNYYKLYKKFPEKFFNNAFFNTHRVEFARTLFRIKIYDFIKDIKGSIVELGTYKGNNLMLFYHLMLALEPTNYEDKVIGFDTFKGFTNINKKKDHNKVFKKDFSNTDFSFLKELISVNKSNDIIKHIEKVILVKGDAVKTIPKFCKSNKALIVKLLYLDCPIYKPTITALKKFYPLMPKGSVIAFDELGMEKWKGETVAFKEFFKNKKLKINKFYFEPSASYIIKE